MRRSQIWNCSNWRGQIGLGKLVRSSFFSAGCTQKNRRASPAFMGFKKFAKRPARATRCRLAYVKRSSERPGSPQRMHICVMSSVSRYRMSEKRFEKNVETHGPRIIGLTVSGIHGNESPLSSFRFECNSRKFPEWRLTGCEKTLNVSLRSR